MTRTEYTFRTALHPPQCLSSRPGTGTGTGADTAAETTLIYPSPTNPAPATNHPVFTHAMHIRHRVFVLEQQVSADAEMDEDDARSWQWVVYARRRTQQGDDHDHHDGDEIPVGVTRLVPPPHAPHEHTASSSGSNSSATSSSTETRVFDTQHEPYVKITRVAVLEEFRGYGLARFLMQAVEEWARCNKAVIDSMYARVVGGGDGSGAVAQKNEWRGLIGLHAQVQVEKMYSRLGYVTDESLGRWDEEGIEHVGMFKRVDVLDSLPLR